MSYDHEREFGREREYCGAECRHWRAQLHTALRALQTIAALDGEEDYKNTGGKTAVRTADVWLVENGYEGGDKLRERARRAERAELLDAEIERLRAERAKL